MASAFCSFSADLASAFCSFSADLALDAEVTGFGGGAGAAEGVGAAGASDSEVGVEFSALNFSTKTVYAASSSARIALQITAISGAFKPAVKRSAIVSRQWRMKANQAFWPTAATRLMGAALISVAISFVRFWSSSRGRPEMRASVAVMVAEDILGLGVF